MSKTLGAQRKLVVVLALLGLLATFCGGSWVVLFGLHKLLVHWGTHVLLDRRNGVQRNVEGIRAAEIAYRATHGAYLPISMQQVVTPVYIERHGTAWHPDSPLADLAWESAVAVKSTYRVRVSTDGEDFTVVGFCDADHDFEGATITATRDTPAALETPPDVF